LPSATSLRVSPEYEILKLARWAQTLRILVVSGLQYSAAREGSLVRLVTFVGGFPLRIYLANHVKESRFQGLTEISDYSMNIQCIGLMA